MDIFQRKGWLRRWAATKPDICYPNAYRSKAIQSVRLSMKDYVQDDDLRRQVLGWLFLDSGECLSSSKLTDGQLDALKHWLKVLPSGNGWSISQEAAGELRQMAAHLSEKPEHGPVIRKAIKMGGMVNGDDGSEPKKREYYQFE